MLEQLDSQRCCLVTKLYLTLCNLMDCSMPSFPVLHCLPAFAQTHVHWVGDAIQPPHPLSPSSPPALNLSQHQGLLQWISSLHQVAKALELPLQHQSFQWIFSTDFPQDGPVWSHCPTESQEASPTPQFESINSVVLSLLYGPTLRSIHGCEATEKAAAPTRRTFVGKAVSLLFNRLSRFVTAFLPRSKHLSVRWSDIPISLRIVHSLLWFTSQRL